uniref:odorant receptor 131-2-like n=1 Tax=Doryrhamphus excisus TaxID=161450 RepID=UPI0025ADFDCD|nr:odorant receptor 131-2-like [Doryrhamphus excisus]
MLRQALSQSNVTRLGLVERTLSSSLTSITCLVFLFINGVMMFTLRSKPVFRETSRYILLFHLLLADTIQMAISQVLYLLHICRIIITYPVCGVLTMLVLLTSDISPMVLVVMSLERYVAVCHALRHASIVTIKKTMVVVLAVWMFSSLNILTRVLLLLKFPFDEMESLQMPKLCDSTSLILMPVSDHYNTAYTGFLFTLAALAIVCSYIGVTMAARLVLRSKGDKESARKAQRTLLLHLVQLGLTLMSFIHATVMIVLYRFTSRIVFLRTQAFLFVCFFFMPRCMGSLIYGLRDQTIRVVLMYYICRTLKMTVTPVKAELVT